MDELGELRSEIDAVDDAMTALFEKRMQILEKVADYKKEHPMNVQDGTREQSLIERNLAHISDEKIRLEYRKFIDNVLKISRSYQHKLLSKGKVAYQGAVGAFAYISARNAYPDSEYVAFPTFEDVFRAVENGEVEAGVVPFENAYAGEVADVSDLLRAHNVFINKMFDLEVHQNLIGINGAELADITEVHSHPQALNQASVFLKGRDLKLVAETNTALAAKYVADEQEKHIACIASKEVAEIFDLKVLAENIESTVNNTTRFIVLTREQSAGGDYFQLQWTVKNEPGTLAQAVQTVANAGFNMQSIRSHPIKNRPWEYYFHIELQGKFDDPATQKMLSDLGKVCEDIKVLGAYYK
ncbi:MAG: chorismate mutase [Bifidobacteriaceae bacterium]|jgi:chorismate mutase/prephenate dehydratase|nr:chorismate mutase [Bifidobacteriaceae bacterium]